MSAENVELARRCLEAFNKGGLPAAERFLDPEIVFDQSRSPFPDAGVYHGIEGVREWFDGLFDAFGEVHYDVEQVRDLGERVAVMLRVRGRGPGSGIEVEYRFVPLLTFRKGRIVRMDRFTEWEEALAAPGPVGVTMSLENAEIVRQALQANRSGPPDATTEVAVALCDPRVELTSRIAAVEGATFRGHDGIRRYFAGLAEAWDEWRNDPDEIIEIQPDVVVVDNLFRGVGKRSGVPIEVHLGVVFVLSAGKLVQIHSYPTREEALEAAGIRE
jgi:ketosteroid isomerase-like protein